MPSKIHKIIFFPEIKKKYVCLPYLKFSDPLPKTHINFFFIWPYHIYASKADSDDSV